MSRVTVYFKDSAGKARRRSFDSRCFTFEDSDTGRRVHFYDYPAGGYFSQDDTRPTLTAAGQNSGVLAVNSAAVIL